MRRFSKILTLAATTVALVGALTFPAVGGHGGGGGGHGGGGHGGGGHGGGSFGGGHGGGGFSGGHFGGGSMGGHFSAPSHSFSAPSHNFAPSHNVSPHQSFSPSAGGHRVNSFSSGGQNNLGGSPGHRSFGTSPLGGPAGSQQPSFSGHHAFSGGSQTKSAPSSTGFLGSHAAGRQHQTGLTNAARMNNTTGHHAAALINQNHNQHGTTNSHQGQFLNRHSGGNAQSASHHGSGQQSGNHHLASLGKQHLGHQGQFQHNAAHQFHQGDQHGWNGNYHNWNYCHRGSGWWPGWGWGGGWGWGLGWGWGWGYGGWGWGYPAYAYTGWGWPCFIGQGLFSLGSALTCSGYYGGYWYNPCCDYGPVGAGSVLTTVPGDAVATADPNQAGALAANQPVGEKPKPGAKDAENARVFAEKGESDFRARDYKSAVYAWKHALIDDPSNGVLTMMLAQGFFATGQYNEAAGATQQAMQLLPAEEWGVVVKNYKELYGNVQDFTDQLRALEKAVKDKPNDPALRFLAGFQYAYLGYPKEAIDQLDKGLKVAPRDDLAKKLREEMQAKLPKTVEPPSPGLK